MLQNSGLNVQAQTLLDISKDIELNYIEAALRKTKGKVQPAAKLLGITRSMLNRQIAKMGIKPTDYK